MKLRRPYIDRLVAFLFGMLLLGGAASVAYTTVTEDLGWFGLLYCWAVVLFGLAIGGPLVRHAVMPFRVDIDAQGWSVRTPKLNRYVRWDEVATVLLADAPATARRGITAAPRLLLVPAAGVSLGVPLSEESAVGGQAAVELFQLSEVDYGEELLLRDLAALAGYRFHNLCRQLTLPAGAIPLRRFPDEPDHARLTRWLDWRKALLFAGWYLLVLVPSLLFIGLATQRNELLGGIVLVASVAGIAAAFKIWRVFGGCRNLVDGAAMINGTDLVTGVDTPTHPTSLHSGTVDILRPGSVKGCGKAWLLTQPGHKGRPTVDLLLSDPRTGRLRSREDLRALEAVLRVSPYERDRAAGQQLQELAMHAPEALPTTPSPKAVPASAYVIALWHAVKGVGRAVVLFGVVGTVAIGGGWADENSAVVGPALILTAAGLFGVWILYALYRTWGLLDALLTIAARAIRGAR
ncbi:hypothetical protein [Micromonospora sp. M61]|uniref:hypothetical protein n=1 Tax=Micromonospora sp. M61 TaxID=2824890 RepID=UPI001B38F23D|nr:hypothetical protein [Micromonospora sp. M61]MBQ0981897.1 hypothetical protein [Micromonospora sp. M61]